MNAPRAVAPEPSLAERLAVSARHPGDAAPAEVRAWLAGTAARARMRVDRVPLEEVDGWSRDPVTGDLGHRSGRFFTITGLRVRDPDGPVPEWTQPIIDQPEVGVLGILVKEFDGVLHFLMQAKVEPGNHGGPQLSPTVQATHSNYTRVHQGSAVPYLDHFTDASRPRLVDVRQSEQGTRFLRKRNRNMVVEAAGDVEVLDGFRWLTLGQVHRLLEMDDVVNMDARTVLGCLPFTDGPAPHGGAAGRTAFGAALLRSCDPEAGALHPMPDLLSWITEARTASGMRAEPVPLAEADGWEAAGGAIAHRTGRFFSVIGVHVTAGAREVGRWGQPLVAPAGTGVIAFLAAPIDGVLHVLVRAAAEPGFVDVAELGPTVQCTPENHAHLPAAARPPFLDEVLAADPDRIRFGALLSEEGGRFHHARNRYLVVETRAGREPPGFRWAAVHQLGALVRHSHYLNVEARTLLACLHSLTSAPGGAR
ncbi:NDP-hexose 2,3-dehydratase family protein [Actinomadura sp. WMMB 499]|uniref:NDP-hexose 2,3-dehydratase family protein n=1 Tax=Actinomadura sp. WMMB 499 TaxID=1219491 RepID=UPI0012480D2C|nr:NDP-hexose 2,3-dehydratase family protein [Actinomadura sp. WMMB 499]QFG24771.1 NDP-hexose 2,3-dehydratase [Actinomadura sp. WMMB 499]